MNKPNENGNTIDENELISRINSTFLMLYRVLSLLFSMISMKLLASPTSLNFTMTLFPSSVSSNLAISKSSFPMISLMISMASSFVKFFLSKMISTYSLGVGPTELDSVDEKDEDELDEVDELSNEVVPLDDDEYEEDELEKDDELSN